VLDVDFQKGVRGAWGKYRGEEVQVGGHRGAEIGKSMAALVGRVSSRGGMASGIALDYDSPRRVLIEPRAATICC
jgi:hypothetical protein